jgi:hypothetical protein
VLANVADITATADGVVLQRAAGALAFAPLPLTALATQISPTVLANLSGAPAPPTAAPVVGAALGVALADIGSWTPTVYGSSTVGVTTFVAGGDVGQYTRIGDLVFFWARVHWTAVTGTGNFRIGGLPFTCRAGSSINCDYPVNVYVNGTLAVAQAPVVIQGTTTIEMDQYTAGAPPAVGQTLPVAGDLMISGFYPI